MKIETLGTGGYHPNEVRHTACYLLPDQHLLFDAGTAAFRVAERYPHKDLHLFLTHPHWDHIIGLTYLYVPMMLGQLETVTLYGNRRTLDAVRMHLFAEPTFAHMPDFKLVELETIESSEITIEDATVSWHPLPRHPGGSTAYRVTHGGKSLVYLTDTYADGSYDDFIRGADLLLHECYFSDELSDWAEKTGHSYLTQVAELAARCSVKQLSLIHIDPRENSQSPWDLSAARKIFPKIEFARDLEVVNI